eukprot:202083-Pelagomonas_calceolata.AAC.4
MAEVLYLTNYGWLLGTEVWWSKSRVHTAAYWAVPQLGFGSQNLDLGLQQAQHGRALASLGHVPGGLQGEGARRPSSTGALSDGEWQFEFQQDRNSKKAACAAQSQLGARTTGPHGG